MRCPYCNKTLKQIKFVDTFTCLNPYCKKALGMTGTLAMWEKVASLAKIRNAGAKYSKAHKAEKAAYQRQWWKKKKEKQDARN